MTGAETIREILSLYQKYGWSLRRVLLSPETETRLSGSLEDLFAVAEITSSKIDAAWFSRPSKAGGETWELRHLAETPFALVEVFGSETPTAVRDAALQETAARMNELKSVKHSVGDA